MKQIIAFLSVILMGYGGLILTLLFIALLVPIFIIAIPVFAVYACVDMDGAIETLDKTTKDIKNKRVLNQKPNLN